MSKSTLSLIEDVVTYRDRISERADRDMLADVANELSSLNALKAELLGALDNARSCLYFAIKANVDIEGFDPGEHIAIKRADAAIAKATSPSASIGGS